MALAGAGERITRQRMLDIVGGVGSGRLPTQTLHRKRPEVSVLRVSLETGESLIVKLWRLPKLPWLTRTLARAGSLGREWAALTRLSQVGVPVPRPLGCCACRADREGWVHALFMEDLGDCRTASSCIKQLVVEEKDETLEELENGIIELTHGMVTAGILDPDHSVVNIAVPLDGRPVRLDLECARRVRRRFFRSRPVGRMLGRLIATYTFAVQPESARAERFAARLAERIRPTRGALAKARELVDRLLELQKQYRGIDTRIALPW